MTKGRQGNQGKARPQQRDQRVDFDVDDPAVFVLLAEDDVDVVAEGGADGGFGGAGSCHGVVAAFGAEGERVGAVIGGQGRHDGGVVLTEIGFDFVEGEAIAVDFDMAAGF